MGGPIPGTTEVLGIIGWGPDHGGAPRTVDVTRGRSSGASPRLPSAALSGTRPPSSRPVSVRPGSLAQLEEGLHHRVVRTVDVEDLPEHVPGHATRSATVLPASSRPLMKPRVGGSPSSAIMTAARVALR